MIQQVKDVFIERFTTNPRMFRSPGRINIIGEHTDYNDGYVLPAAISKEIYFAVAPNDKNQIRMFSFDFNEYYEVTVKAIASQDTNVWANYLLGVIAQLQKKNFQISGIDVVFGGTIPIGAGLSSSAAIECGFLYAINEIFNCGLSKIEIVKMAQMAEHEFAGVKCGIMDQFAVVFGKKNSVIQLDCKTLEYSYSPLLIDGYEIILCNTGVKHNLASSEYNIRRKECEDGVLVISKLYPFVKSLRDVTLEMIKECANDLSGSAVKRCSYVVCENLRLHKLCKALQENNIVQAGKLMYETHDGLQNEYGVSCKELDVLVEIAKKTPGVIGSRMMGGGFGGCTISIVKKESIDIFLDAVREEYYAKFVKPELIYKVQTADGVGEL